MIKRWGLGCLRLDAKNVRYHRGKMEDTIEGQMEACCIQAHPFFYKLPCPRCSVMTVETKS